jgi:hypothetical protein
MRFYTQQHALSTSDSRSDSRSRKKPPPAGSAPDAYFGFVAAYRNAAEKLRAGNRNQPFPTGCFPPALPFVGG